MAKPKGRPSTYTPEMVADICQKLSEGKSLRAICDLPGMPAQSTVFLWLQRHSEFSEQYACARVAQAEFWADQIVEIADDTSADVVFDEDGNERAQHEIVQRSRLRVDTRKWLMSKLAPKKYGDRVVAEHVGRDGGPIETVDLSETEVARRIAFTLARGARAAGDETTKH
jgi:hypothetical protein